MGMQEIYVVMVINGEAADREERHVQAYLSRSAADAFVTACNEWARCNGVSRRSEGAILELRDRRRLSTECPGRPADSRPWEIDYTGVEWAVRPVPLASKDAGDAMSSERAEALARLSLCEQLLSDKFPKEASAPLTLAEACEIAAELERVRFAVREAMEWNWLEEGADRTIPRSVWEQCESAGALPSRRAAAKA